MRAHVLPLAGGLHDQPDAFVEALHEFWAAQAVHEREQAKMKARHGGG